MRLWLCAVRLCTDACCLLLCRCCGVMMVWVDATRTVLGCVPNDSRRRNPGASCPPLFFPPPSAHVVNISFTALFTERGRTPHPTMPNPLEWEVGRHMWQLAGGDLSQPVVSYPMSAAAASATPSPLTPSPLTRPSHTLPSHPPPTVLPLKRNLSLLPCVHPHPPPELDVHFVQAGGEGGAEGCCSHHLVSLG